jgi:hypothetical protein
MRQSCVAARNPLAAKPSGFSERGFGADGGFHMAQAGAPATGKRTLDQPAASA